MPPYHLSSTSRALYRVFVAPNLTAPPLHIPLRPQNKTQAVSRLLPRNDCRHKSFKRTQNQHNLRTHFVLDEGITSEYINVVDANGKFRQATPLTRVLATIDRARNHLVQVTPGDKGIEPDPSDPETLPTCKIQSKQDLRIQLAKIQDIQKKAEKQKAGLATKQLELNWAIDANDLRHRLERVKDFLTQGRKVEVILGPKRRGKAATEQECKAVLKKIRDVVEECKGAKESKVEGDVGKSMTLYFEGVPQKKEKSE